MLVLTAVLAGCAPAAVTTQGDAIGRLYTFFTAAAAVVFTVVAGLILWSVVRYRRRGDDLPKQIHGSNKLELTWTIIPFVLVLVLIWATLQAQSQVEHRAPNPAVTVRVIAFQWSWIFEYEGMDTQVVGGPDQVPEMVVPTGRPVHVKLESADVVHAFYVPRTLFKRQAIPGRVNEFDLTFDQPGVYHGQCTQYCGVAHGDMLFTVRAVSDTEFRRWLEGARGGSPGGAGT